MPSPDRPSLPLPAEPERAYVAVAGDTLWSIGQQFGVSVEEMLTANPQISRADRIWVGQLIHVPLPGRAAPPIRAIAVGGAHNCALTSDGRVTCWGRNYTGALGNGTVRADSSTPVDVIGLPSAVVAIAAGGGHACALTDAGRVWCWGSNSEGQLGNGGTRDSSFPVEVEGLGSDVVAITAGAAHTCALNESGGVKCWGANNAGQLGNGNGSRVVTVPVQVHALDSGVRAITAGGYHTCALMNDSAVRCWGQNYSGELGNGDTLARPIPDEAIHVGGETLRAEAVALGEAHTCALAVGGDVLCWGRIAGRPLVEGAFTRSLTPVAVPGVDSTATRIVALSAGWDHTCALGDTGAVWCWGENGSGQLGDGTRTAREVPVPVTGLPGTVMAVSVGDHTCALTNRGVVWCWGSNYGGALGDGTRTDSATPVRVSFDVYEVPVLRPSVPAGKIAAGTSATFTATVRPFGLPVAPITVRFVVYGKSSGPWQKVATEDQPVDAAGKTTLRWTFASAGSWYVRARVLGNTTYAASDWGALVQYEVE